MHTPPPDPASVPESCYDTLRVGAEQYAYLSLQRIFTKETLASLPRSVRILCENVARRSPHAIPALETWAASRSDRQDVPFYPERVLMHDTTCSPALVDFAAMRDGVAEGGGDPSHINPAIQVDLVIDHSVMVDYYARDDAAELNLTKDFGRNGERYRFIRWAEQSLARFRVVPPGSGILHQVNLEYLAEVVKVVSGEPLPLLVPDTLIGTDSHTPMINALGIVAWGVGGIEAQAAMLGEPISIVLPRVVGVHVTGALRPGVTATDLVLHLTRTFRDHGVVDKFVEFHGPGLAALSVGDRATVANMAPEYGSTCSYFPIDAHTLAYLATTGRSAAHIERVEAYARAQGLWNEAGKPPHFDETIALDLADVQPLMSGPRQPHQRQPLPRVWESFRAEFQIDDRAPPPDRGGRYADGLVSLAAITSCTNTSNPALLVGAGLLARNARRRGLTRKPWVKTSLSPGSKVVSDYLASSGLQDDLDALGFNLTGYGCMTCIGNSGLLEPDVVEAVEKHGLRTVGVISGNRNFDGRVNPHLAGAYLASPALCVAAAIAGTVKLDYSKDALAIDPDGAPVMLADLWPTREAIDEVLALHLKASQFVDRYRDIWKGSAQWRALSAPGSALFPWDEHSHYIRRPPYASRSGPAAMKLAGARPLLVLGDNVTTDHISPAGRIPADSVAGRHLRSVGVQVNDFNQYSTRRTNHEVMMRGAFSNPRLINEIAIGADGKPLGAMAWSADRSRLLPPYEAALTYPAGTPLVVLAGKNYGAGSSRDWAAKAPTLLGVKAVIAESFERIHRSNLIGLGIVPLEFAGGRTRADLCATGEESYDIDLGGLRVGINKVPVRITRANGAREEASLECRIDSVQELDYLRHQGVLPYIVQKTLAAR